MSSTEREALAAGTVGFEKELFNGNPDFDILLTQPKIELTTEEKYFFDHTLKKLCQLLDDWVITHEQMDLPAEVWKFIQTKGFLGLIIPKEYGGLAFSSTALAELLTQLCGKSTTAGTTVAVANSLGPAELLLNYGTQEQKDYYLPRLAKGEEIPCFALTNPEAGSDAASIPDRGIVCRKEWNGKEIIGINLNWNKRYITLCPIATVMGLAFYLLDPKHLLGDKEDIGITCALIPSNTPGITKGRRHFPIGTAFLNGPTQGKDVFIPLDWVIGGEEKIGCGWRMLMECLSAGRGISLPAGAAGSVQVATLASGAYTRIRQQFHLPLAQFEGIEASLAKMAGYTYIINAALRATTAMIDQDAKPALLSGIVKCYTTEFARKVLMEAMDVHGGKAICLGPKNYLARAFEASSIGITVEGANILTRNLIIYGQGAMRCHPFLNEEMVSVQNNDVKRFHKAIWGHFCLVFKHLWRVIMTLLSPLFFCRNRSYLKEVSYYSARFAFLSDMMMLLLGTQLKRKERISARLADILSFLYFISVMLKDYQKEDVSLLNWSCQTLLHDIEEAMWDIVNNLPKRGWAWVLKRLVFPFGRRCLKPSDRIEHEIAMLMTHDTDTRTRLCRHVFKEALPNNPLGQLELAFKKVLAVEEIERKMMHAMKEGKINGFTREERMKAALAKHYISKQEADAFLEAELLRQSVLAVDDFESLMN